MKSLKPEKIEEIPEDLGIKIASKEEETWVIFRQNLNQEIPRLENQITEINKAIVFQKVLLSLANEKLENYDKQ